MTIDMLYFFKQKIKFARLEHDFKDLKEKFSEEAKERKKLYNKLIEIKG